jgi:hypothetical protein
MLVQDGTNKYIFLQSVKLVLTNQDPDRATEIMFFLIHTPKGWNQFHMFTNPISVICWPLHTILYSSKPESNKIIHPTKTSSTPTKTQTMLQSLYVLPTTYS